MKKRLFSLLLIAAFFLLVGCNLHLNQPIEVADGEKVHHNLTTVNGDITIGRNCDVRATSRAVNGNIRVGANSKVRQIQSVNGFCDIGKGVLIAGDIETVNGWINFSPGVIVQGDVKSINGSITLTGTTVEHDIKLYNGSLDIIRKSKVEGDIIVGKIRNSHDSNQSLRIVIADSSIVEGDIVIKDRDRTVRIYLKSGGRIMGNTDRAVIIRE